MAKVIEKINKTGRFAGSVLIQMAFKCFGEILTRAMMTFFSKTAVDDPLSGQRILVLAPHVDDEVIGCGGALVHHKMRGAAVSVAYITDSARSFHPSLSREAVSRLRAEEARQVQEYLGFNEIYFMNCPDGNVEGHPHAQGKLIDILKSTAYDVIYLPFFVDHHRDHLYTNTLLLRIIGELELKPTIVAYPVQVPMPLSFINRVISIDDAIEKKQRSLRLFQSQIHTLATFFDTLIDVNHFYSRLAQNDQARYAEVFFVATADRYRELYSIYQMLGYPKPKFFSSHLSFVPAFIRSNFIGHQIHQALANKQGK